MLYSSSNHCRMHKYANSRQPCAAILVGGPYMVVSFVTKALAQGVQESFSSVEQRPHPNIYSQAAVHESLVQDISHRLGGGGQLGGGLRHHRAPFPLACMHASEKQQQSTIDGQCICNEISSSKHTRYKTSPKLVGTQNNQHKSTVVTGWV